MAKPPATLPTAPSAPPPLSIVELSTEALEPNPWNPNQMDPLTRAKLKAYLSAEGLVQPLVVRPHPDTAERYQILGGFHRWSLCAELGWEMVPCVVLEVDDRRAKILTVNLNELSGDPLPHLMAELLYDLNHDSSLEDLVTQLPYSLREMEDSLELLKLPSGLDLQLEKAVREHEAGSPTQLTFLVDEAQPVESAIEEIAEGLEGKNRRGRALVQLAQWYLAAHASTEE